MPYINNIRADFELDPIDFSINCGTSTKSKQYQHETRKINKEKHKARTLN